MERGALGVALRLSRVVGAAPALRDAAGRYRPSTPLLVYGALVATCAGVYALTIATLVLRCKQHAAWRATDVIHISCNVVEAAILISAAATGAGRMARINTLHKKLDQVGEKFNQNQSPAENRLTILLILYIIGCILLRSKEFSPIKEKYFQDGWLCKCSVRSACCAGLSAAAHALYMAVHGAADVLVAQLALSARVLLAATRHINATLQLMISDAHFKTSENFKVSEQMRRPAWEEEEQDTRGKVNNIFNRSYNKAFSTKVNCEASAPSEQSAQLAIRRLANTYMSVCDYIRASNTSDGFLVCALLVSCVLYTEKHLFKVMVWQTLNVPYDFLFAHSLLWCAMLSLMMACVVEPCHRTRAQMLRTRTILNRLKCRRWDDAAVANELDAFARLLALHSPAHAPLHVLTLERSLLVKIYGCLVSYLVIILTYARNP